MADRVKEADVCEMLEIVPLQEALLGMKHRKTP